MEQSFGYSFAGCCVNDDDDYLREGNFHLRILTTQAHLHRIKIEMTPNSTKALVVIGYN